MDYDDNDFQSQNLHLAGEGSTKFPPVLRPYALPKFDFDESLQGHLRFDSLVETEVFLGIESNEDNQWIDAYSRGSSGIDFSSTAAESCSILRHNNVWSEATSTESVEMLLKSVGQEEFIPKQTATQESDACDELACLAKQMEPKPKLDDTNDFRDDVIDLQPPGCIHESLSGSKEDVEMEQSLAGVPQIHEGELSIGGSLSTLQPYDICRNIAMPVSGGIAFIDGKSNTTNQSKVETLADSSLDDSSLDEKTQDDSSASGAKTSITAASTQNISSTCYVLNIQNAQNQVVGMGAEEQSSSQIQTNKQDLESTVINKDSDADIQTLDGNAVGREAQHADKPFCSVPMEEALESASVVGGLETGVSILKDSSGMVSDGVYDLQKAERCSENTCFRDLSQGNPNEDAMLITDAQVADQSALNTCDLQKVAIKDDSYSEGQVDTIEKNYSHSSVSQDKELLNIDHNMDTEILLSKSEASMFAVVDNNICTASEGNNDSRAGGFSRFGMEASTKSCILSDATRVCEKNIPDGQSDPEIIFQDVSVNDRESKKVPSDSSQKHGDVDQSHHVDEGFGSSSCSVDRVEAVLAVSTASADVMPVSDSASQLRPENISPTSREMVDVPPTPCTVDSTLEVTDLIEIQKMTVVESASVDANKDFDAKIAEEADIFTSKQILCETVDTCLQNRGTAAAEKCDEVQAKLSDKDNQECAKEDSMDPVLFESTEKQGYEVKVSFIKDGKEALQENHDKSSTKISGEILPANEGTVSSAPPFPGSHTELNQTGGCPAYTTNNACEPSSTFGSPPETEKDGNQVKVSANLKPPISELINRDATNTSSVHGPKVDDATKDGGSLTSANFPKEGAADLTTKGKDVGKTEPFYVTATNKASKVVEGSALASGLRVAKTIARNISHGSPQIFDGEVALSVSKGTPERKTRRASNKTVGKESSRKGSNGKEKTLLRQSDKGARSTSLPVSPPPGFQLMQSDSKPYGHIDVISSKPFSLLNASTSSLPDLNTSASPRVLFQQPFTDIQQVQLRAQIFVYGALIQATTPDEAHMISAFGGPDGERNIWERAWRSCMERQRGQKSYPINLETPPQSRPGPRAADLAVKQSALQGKSGSSPLGQASNNGTPTIVNPLIPLSSPLWSLPTPTCDSQHSSALARGSVVDYPQALTSVHPYQTPPLRNFLGHNTSWMSQAPLRGPWIASPAPDNRSSLSASPITDTIKLSSAMGYSIPPSSGKKNAPPGVPALSACLQNIFVGTAPLDTRNVTASQAQPSDPKPKKRKKDMVSEDLGQKPSQSQIELTPGVLSHISTVAAIATPVRSVPITTFENSAVSVCCTSLANNLRSDGNIEKKTLSHESLTKVEEARVDAEEASILSVAAVNHSLEIWKQLDKQKNYGLVSDIEAKLASAAVAVAAAAAVAKAAAAAANVASNAALQAKQIAEEALAVYGLENSGQMSISEGLSNLGKATPASILKGANGTNSSASIIVAAKEAARRNVEAASAATKRAENMDAIVKAAELAAEAVSQAGKIVTMGDPLPLSDLVEASRESTRQDGLLIDLTSGLVNVDNNGERPETLQTCNRDISSDLMGEPVAANEKFINDISTSIKTNKKCSKGPKGCKVSTVGDPVDVLPESETEIKASSAVGNGSVNLEDNNIKEGSLVEVFKDGDGFKAAWFTANILSLKDAKAYVCYSVLVADEGPLKEWVSLEGEGDKPPKIRTARPLTALHNEGTRKRRRSTMIDHIWSVGDRVETWRQESWQEGVITEKNKKDETLTVHFPASGETSVVRAWHLRPYLIWKDGKWIESSKAGTNDGSTREGDTPHEKRPKLGNPAVDVKGKDKMSKGIDAVNSANPGELRLLNLIENDEVFNIGKNSKNENKPETLRTARTGLQKEGPRVIFGVPKPGKKRKFMDVSKHYVADGTHKINDGNDSLKLTNFLMPQGSGPRGWKNSSKNDTKEKPADPTKPKTFKPIKPHKVLGRVVPPKENSSSTSHCNDATSRTQRSKDSSSQLKNAASQSQNKVESASSSGTTSARGGSVVYSLASSTDYLPTKKTSTSLRESKVKLAPAGGKSGQVEVEKTSAGNLVKSTSDVMEPRRSIRRIQPTARLLEGLQSSLIISKTPSGSHDKGHKNQIRTASRGNSQG